jgi:hypothetical protein
MCGEKTYECPGGDSNQGSLCWRLTWVSSRFGEKIIWGKVVWGKVVWGTDIEQYIHTAFRFLQCNMYCCTGLNIIYFFKRVLRPCYKNAYFQKIFWHCFE